MRLIAKVWAVGPQQDLARALGPALWSKLTTELPANEGAQWLFRLAGDDLGLLPRFRARFSELGLDHTEQFLTQFAAGERTDALLLLTPGELSGARVVGELGARLEVCSECGQRPVRPTGVERLTVALPNAPRGHLFHTEKLGLPIASRELVQALEDAGLTSGLVRIPVDGADGFVAIHADASLGWPVAPFGEVRPPCSTCGSVHPAWSLFAAYDEVRVVSHWSYSEVRGAARPIVSATVHDWFQGPGQRFLKPVPGGFAPNFSRVGVYPRDVEHAFLPEPYRG